MTQKSDTKPRSCINTQKNMKTASFMMQAAREKEMFFKIHSLLYLNVLHQENLKPYMGLFNVDNLLMAPIPSFGYNRLAIMNSCRCCSLDDKQMNKKGFSQQHSCLFKKIIQILFPARLQESNNQQEFSYTESHPLYPLQLLI